MEENNIPEWQERLLEERENLLDKVIKLRKFSNNPESKLCREEWGMLGRLLEAMKEYLDILTQRCRYYKLLNTPQLDTY